ncbi:DUF262 domain-containing protein [Frigoribacterium sp. MCBA15_019]|uniref:DUF262 domain-containing protein n=1 Tax=Frigoribacterium sp. MCBA15_019 TaxID=1898745 RepID=UPI0009F55F70|nr:DUF262 domain-containing protein [Frigoribacterium sp. MCBA15_019]
MKLEKSDLQLETIVSRIRGNELDLQPDFQRGEIWDNPRRQRLVDTILREWYVPAIHIVLDTDGEEVVLDGQQRLAAVRDFFDDKVKVNGLIEPIDAEIEQLHGLKYSQLPVAARRAVNRFVITVVTLSDHDPQEPNELFFRLNQSYNLTPPEKRNALHGRARDQVKRLVEDLTIQGLLEPATVGFSNGRLAYDDIVARTCVAIEIGNLRQHINNTVVESYYRSSEPFSDLTIDHLRESASLLLQQIRSTPTSKVRFNKGTLQTWLIYCHWAPRLTGQLPQDLLTSFENSRAEGKTGERSASRAVVEMLRLYDDRASYRVTDVSSVLVRDLAIHVYSQATFLGSESYRGSDQLVSALEADPEDGNQIVASYLEKSEWGSLINEWPAS